MTDVLKGKVVADRIKEQMKKDIQELKQANKTPRLGIVRLGGDNPGDISYEKKHYKKTAIMWVLSLRYMKETGILKQRN